jgi:hypothetical protein
MIGIFRFSAAKCPLRLNGGTLLTRFSLRLCRAQRQLFTLKTLMALQRGVTLAENEAVCKGEVGTLLPPYERLSKITENNRHLIALLY